MARSTQTVKSIFFTSEQKYKKEMMVQILQARGMIDDTAKKYILSGIK